MVDVRGDDFRPPYYTTPSAVKANKMKNELYKACIVQGNPERLQMYMALDCKAWTPQGNPGRFQICMALDSKA